MSRRRSYYYKASQQLMDDINLDYLIHYMKKNQVSFQKYSLNTQADIYEGILINSFQAQFSNEGYSKREKEIDIYKLLTDFIETCFDREYNFSICSDLFQVFSRFRFEFSGYMPGF